MKTITAVIPVRTGSTRLKNKNVVPFAITNLLLNKLQQLKQVSEITSIVVSSDSDIDRRSFTLYTFGNAERRAA